MGFIGPLSFNPAGIGIPPTYTVIVMCACDKTKRVRRYFKIGIICVFVNYVYFYSSSSSFIMFNKFEREFGDGTVFFFQITNWVNSSFWNILIRRVDSFSSFSVLNRIALYIMNSTRLVRVNCSYKLATICVCVWPHDYVFFRITCIYIICFKVSHGSFEIKTTSTILAELS